MYALRPHPATQTVNVRGVVCVYHEARILSSQLPTKERQIRDMQATALTTL